MAVDLATKPRRASWLATRCAAVLLAACAAPDVSPPMAPQSPMTDKPEPASAEPSTAEPSAPSGESPDERAVSEASAAEVASGETAAAESSVAAPSVAAPSVAPPSLVPPPDTAGEVWLKGDTHVHAHASGDSSEPNENVIAWYAAHHYDFLVLTDHNRVSELAPEAHTAGQVALRDPALAPIVLSGMELTHNPEGCLPAGDPSGRCRIHVNLLGPTARPAGRIEWAERHSHQRLDMYRAALDAQARYGGLVQINHPNWYWGVTPDLLVELSRRGVRLVEIANSAFAKWNAGDAAHPSTEALWDAALMRGATLYGVASDDAHDYPPDHGKYPPGGGWIVVRARRDPAAILAAIEAGRFYASNGVVLARAEVEDHQLVVAIDPGATAGHTIEFIENGQRVASVRGRTARRKIPRTGYLRAVVTRADGAHAWLQPVRW